MASIVTHAIAASEVALGPVNLLWVIRYAFERCSSELGKVSACLLDGSVNDDLIANTPCISEKVSHGQV